MNSLKIETIHDLIIFLRVTGRFYFFTNLYVILLLKLFFFEIHVYYLLY